MRRPDQPLIYVNPAFAALAGLPAEAVVGRNCRFLQGPDTDPAAVAAIRAAVARGEECTVTLLNHRGPDRAPWWNEVRLIPGARRRRPGRAVHRHADGRHRARGGGAGAGAERDRTRGYLARLEELAYTDPLTGLRQPPAVRGAGEDGAAGRRRPRTTRWRSLFVGPGRVQGRQRAGSGTPPATSCCRWSPRGCGGRVRRKDLLARLGGDEFLVALPDLDPCDRPRAGSVDGATRLAAVVAEPVRIRRTTVTVSASVGIATFPDRRRRLQRAACTRPTCGCMR